MDKIKDMLKNAWKSKTVIFGLLLQTAPLVQDYYGDVGNPLGYMIVGFVIIGLRAVTTKPLSEK